MAAPQSVLDLTHGILEKRPNEAFGSGRAWRREDLRPSEWMATVTDEVKRELAELVSSLRKQTLPMFMPRPDHFELAAARRMMAEAKRMVDEGRGFAVIDRLPLDDWSEDEARTVYWLLGQLFSRPVAQSPRGAMFREIVNDSTNRGYGNNGANGAGRMTYHTDNSGNRFPPNYASLLCLYGAEEGGVSEYCSMYTMYNALLAEAPLQLERLFHPFFHDRLGMIQAAGEPEVIWAPSVSFDGRRLTSRFSVSKITSGYKKAGQELEPESRVALETLVDIIEQKKMAAQFQLERGHIQFINNREGLHYRTAFRDGPVHKRHMVRLWYRDEGRPYFDG